MKKFSAILLALVLMLSMTAMAASITINSNINATTQGSVAGEQFTAYKIFDAVYVSDTQVSYTVDATSKWYTALQNYAGFSFDEVTGQGKYNVTKTDSFSIDTLTTAIQTALADTTLNIAYDYQWTGYTAQTVAEGYYFITSSLGSNVIIDTFSSPTINTKNSYPSMTKKIVDGDALVDSITAQRGNVEANYVTFQIDVVIPATAVAHQIVVHDILDDDMTYVGNISNTNVTKIDDCTVEDCTCNIAFSIAADTVAANAGKTVSFTYQVAVNADAETATSHTNTAWITYSTFTSITDTVKVFTYEFDVFKYTGTNTPLAGAGFVLKNAEGKYYNNNAGVVTWVNDIANATEYITSTDEDAGAIVNFAGLKNGTYTLIEKTVPAGYNPADDATIIINNANLKGETQIPVLNSTGSELPSTGGIGTTIFYVVGGVLMAAAIVLLVSKRKVAASK